MWIEFFEDLLERDPKAELAFNVVEGDNVQFVTGDAEVDKVEAMMVDPEVDEATILAELASWESGGVAKGPTKTDILRRAYGGVDDHRAALETEQRALEELGDGFDDLAPE